MQEAVNAERAKYCCVQAKCKLAKNRSSEESNNSNKNKSLERSTSEPTGSKSSSSSSDASNEPKNYDSKYSDKSSSLSNSECKVGHKEIYVYENGTEIKKEKKNLLLSEQNPKFQNIDAVIDKAINDAQLLSKLRRPPTITKDGDPEEPALKKLKHQHLCLIIFVKLRVLYGKKNRQFKTRTIKALVDSGATKSIINKDITKHLVIVQNKKPKCWTTAAGLVETRTKTNATFSLPELHANREVTKSLHIVNTGISRYKMIIGRDLISKLELGVRGSDLSIGWEEGAIPWKDMDTTEAADTYSTVNQSLQPFKKEVNRMTDILEANDKKPISKRSL